MNAIIAVNEANFIGKDGKMMWHSKDDFKHFKQMTMGGVLIVGRKTYETCLGGRELPGRTLLVVSTQESPNPLKPYGNLFSVLTHAISLQKPIWVIGGMEIYKVLLPLCNELHISNIIGNAEIGDYECEFEIPDTFKGKIFNYSFKCD